ncbi:MAG: PRC-barrel domain-containing protein, partial [Eubacteriales bacterium]
LEAKTLKGFKFHCLDGEIGTLTEFVFDDRDWTIRYLAVETGTWLIDRQVLISPIALSGVDLKSKYITVNLKKMQIEDSPPLYNNVPITRQFENNYHQYYGLPTYWNGPNIFNFSTNIMTESAAYKEAIQGDMGLGLDLHSTDNVSGRKIQASDGEIGHINDFIIDDEAWVIRYLVINTQNWWPGKKVLISPKWIDHIGSDEFIVYFNVLRDAVKHSLEYTDETELNREYEHGLHKHYERKGYWDDSIVNKDEE